MGSKHQRVRNGRVKRKRKVSKPARKGNPQKRGVCMKLYQKTPKKPNSALRWVTKLRRSTGKKRIVSIPGEGGHGLHEHATVLVRGGRVRDLPGVKYKVIRGARDSSGVAKRKSSRSKYGRKRPTE